MFIKPEESFQDSEFLIVTVALSTGDNDHRFTRWSAIIGIHLTHYKIHTISNLETKAQRHDTATPSVRAAPFQTPRGLGLSGLCGLL